MRARGRSSDLPCPPMRSRTSMATTSGGGPEPFAADPRIAAALSLDELQEIETELLGKASELTRRKASLKDLAPEDRREEGRRVNEERAAVEEAIAARRAELESASR